MYYPAETDTDMSDEARIAELVREQALRLLKEELPHAITAEVVEIEGKHVHVRLYTETESQKQILIGKGGTMVREIGRTARPFVEQLLGHPVYLQLQVKASPKWRRNETMLERLGSDGDAGAVGDELVVTAERPREGGRAARRRARAWRRRVRSVRVSTSPFARAAGAARARHGHPGRDRARHLALEGRQGLRRGVPRRPGGRRRARGAEFRRLIVSAHDAVDRRRVAAPL